jgi:hypothetical protein
MSCNPRASWREQGNSMNRNQCNLPMMLVPTPAQAEVAVRAARTMYQRTLAHWTFDALQLRRTGSAGLTWNGQRSTTLSKAA